MFFALLSIPIGMAGIQIGLNDHLVGGFVLLTLCVALLITGFKRIESHSLERL